MAQRNSDDPNDRSEADDRNGGLGKKTPLVDFSVKLRKEEAHIIRIQAAHRDMSHKHLVLKSLKLYFDTFPIPGPPSL